MKKRNKKTNTARMPQPERRPAPPLVENETTEDFALRLSAMFRAEFGEEDQNPEQLSVPEAPLPAVEADNAAGLSEDPDELLRAVAGFLSEQPMPEAPASEEPSVQAEGKKKSRAERRKKKAAKAQPSSETAPRIATASQSLWAASPDSSMPLGSDAQTDDSAPLPAEQQAEPEPPSERPAVEADNAAGLSEDPDELLRAVAGFLSEQPLPEAPASEEPSVQAEGKKKSRAERRKKKAAKAQPSSETAPRIAAASQSLWAASPDSSMPLGSDAQTDDSAPLPAEQQAEPEPPSERPAEESVQTSTASLEPAPAPTSAAALPDLPLPLPAEKAQDSFEVPLSDPSAGSGSSRQEQSSVHSAKQTPDDSSPLFEDPARLILPGFDATPFYPPREDPPLKEIFAAPAVRKESSVPEDAVQAAPGMDHPFFSTAPETEEAAPYRKEDPEDSLQIAMDSDAAGADSPVSENAASAAQTSENAPDSRLTVSGFYTDDAEILAAVKREIPGLAELLDFWNKAPTAEPTPPAPKQPESESSFVIRFEEHPIDTASENSRTEPNAEPAADGGSDASSRLELAADEASIIKPTAEPLTDRGDAGPEIGLFSEDETLQPAALQAAVPNEASKTADPPSKKQNTLLDQTAFDDLPDWYDELLAEIRAAKTDPETVTAADASSPDAVPELLTAAAAPDPAFIQEAAPAADPPSARPARPERRKRRWFSFLFGKQKPDAAAEADPIPDSVPEPEIDPDEAADSGPQAEDAAGDADPSPVPAPEPEVDPDETADNGPQAGDAAGDADPSPVPAPEPEVDPDETVDSGPQAEDAAGGFEADPDIPSDPDPLPDESPFGAHPAAPGIFQDACELDRLIEPVASDADPVHQDFVLSPVSQQSEGVSEALASESPDLKEQTLPDTAPTDSEDELSEPEKHPADREDAFAGHAPEIWDPLSLFDEPAEDRSAPPRSLSRDTTGSLPSLEDLFGSTASLPAPSLEETAPALRPAQQKKRFGWLHRLYQAFVSDAQADDDRPEEEPARTHAETGADPTLAFDESPVSFEIPPEVDAPVPEPVAEAVSDDAGAPAETEADNAEAPVETEADDAGTPVETEADDAEIPAETEADDAGLPAETEADDAEIPAETEADDAGAPIEAEADDTGTPAETEADDAGTPIEAEADDAGTPIEAEADDAGTPIEAEAAPETVQQTEQSFDELLASIDAVLGPPSDETSVFPGEAGLISDAAPGQIVGSARTAGNETQNAQLQLSERASQSDDWEPLSLFGGQTDDASLPASWEEYLRSLRTGPAYPSDTGPEPAAGVSQWENAADRQEAPPSADTVIATEPESVPAPGPAETAEVQTVPMDLKEPERPVPQRKKKSRRKEDAEALTLEDFLAAAVPMEESTPAEPEPPPVQQKTRTRKRGASRKNDTISTARENPDGLVLTWAKAGREDKAPAQTAREHARSDREPSPPEEPTPSADVRPASAPRRGHREPRREIDVLPAEEKTVLHPEEAYRIYAGPLDTIGSQLILTGLLTILSLFFTLYLAQRWTFLPEIFSGGTTVYILLALLGLMILVNRKLYFRDWHGEHGLRPELLIGAATLFTALDCFSAAKELRPPFTVVAGALLLIALWGRYDRGLGFLTTIKVLREEKLSAGVSEVQDITKGSRGLIRTDPNVDHFMSKLETRDLTDRVLRWYTLAALIGGAVLTVLISFLLKRDFLWTGSLLFLGVVPVTGLLAYPRLFCLLAGRLSLAQAAICGYHGAEVFGGEHAILIGDDDIFPAGSLTLNGFKVYNGNPDRMIAYAAAACRMSGSALDPVFEDLLVTHNGRHYTVDNFRFYDSGGIGASIQQDVVLMGSLDFMRRMGVHMDRGARVKQAVYMSLNGELAAVFAVRYAPPENLRKGLAAIAGNRHFKGILVTRTFLGTPSFLKVKFGIPTGAFQYPSTKERIRLSEAELKRTGAQGAILAKDSFSGFAQAAAGGRMLRSATLGAAILTLLGGVVGLVLMGVLAVLPAYETATALNLLFYTAAWLAPTLLLTAWGRHF